MNHREGITRIIFRASLGLALAACGREVPSDGPVTATSASALSYDNGVRLNGDELNGIRLNGIRLNGIRLNGIRLNGIRLNGIRLNGIRLNGIRLNGVLLNGVEAERIELKDEILVAYANHHRFKIVDGAWVEFTIELDNGATVPLQIRNAHPIAGADADDRVYDVTYFDGDSWQSIGGGDNKEAFLLSGYWNDSATWIDEDDTITIAVRHFVLAKCVEVGYPHWREGLRKYHLSCTRMLRADYCGDGVSHTTDGMLINIADKRKIQVLDPIGQWRGEAGWDEQGATCLGKSLRFESFSQVWCANDLRNVTEKCGEKYKDGAIVIDQIAY